ncbi:tRNA preQ1(34) S-adenosylmethionine ribosyltransferase-isomerase QueA [Candidatus Saccharibacteria bacterium]|nr:tRNA preQ1(34) S-adenosylmethionine ribosyltransferase-isomerase QueA [Candidatus Saccharibacteria bacterium]
MKSMYELPADKIAQKPPRRRGDTKLLILKRREGEIEDSRYACLADWLKPGDLVVLNNTRVMPARLIATTQSGARRELFLTERHSSPLLAPVATVIYRGKLRVGDSLKVGQDSIEVIEILPGGQARIRATVPPVVLAERSGLTPLPPYIKRSATKSDSVRYQTIFAARDGSVAAPTASLNMTSQLMKELKASGITIAKLTLHVGRGTFMPIRDNIENHTMHQEYYSIPSSTLQAIRRTKQAGGRIVAIGTTVTRALEHSADRILSSDEPTIRDEADIFIYPGYDFQVVDVLLTNFHAPESTVLQLAAAFAGPGLLMKAYTYALKSDYAFLSYGDSMLIV